MARIVKTQRKKKLSFGRCVSMIFTFALIFYFVASIFVRAENARLVYEIEQARSKIAQLRVENQELAREVNQLSDYAHIAKIAENAGLAFNTNNRFYINRGE